MGDWKGMGVLLIVMVVAVVIGMAVFFSFGLDAKVAPVGQAAGGESQ